MNTPEVNIIRKTVTIMLMIPPALQHRPQLLPSHQSNLFPPIAPLLQRLVSLHYLTQWTLEKIPKHGLKSLWRPPTPRQFGGIVGNLSRHLGMTLGPIKLLPQITQIRLDGHVMHPRHELLVQIVPGGRDVMEQQSWQTELLERATPRSPSPASQVDVVPVSAQIFEGHSLAASGYAVFCELLVVLNEWRGSLLPHVHGSGELDVGPRHWLFLGLPMLLIRVPTPLRPCTPTLLLP
mmetsp:Transcript_10114/g.18485  ORF Transcript_10114/g.18485 Transcript_10114/m.18485 type:complete len:236 (-) Transcript_10114:471-1178(-)